METLEAEDVQSEQLLTVSDPSTMGVVWQLTSSTKLFEVPELKEQRSDILATPTASNTNMIWETLQANNITDSNIKLKSREILIARKAAKLIYAIDSDS